MPSPQRESFERKAPLVDLEGLARMIVNEMVDPELLERADSVWLYASFVHPEKEIDTGDGLSDLDVFVQVPDWERPVADTGIPIYASGVETPDVYDAMVEESDWDGHDAPDHQWDCSVEEAWEALPGYVRRTLLRGTKRLLYATEADVETGRGRVYDVLVGNESQFAWATYWDEDDRLPIWKDGAIVV